jgi:hypothetical protein
VYSIPVHRIGFGNFFSFVELCWVMCVLWRFIATDSKSDHQKQLLSSSFLFLFLMPRH